MGEWIETLEVVHFKIKFRVKYTLPLVCVGEWIETLEVVHFKIKFVRGHEGECVGQEVN